MKQRKALISNTDERHHVKWRQRSKELCYRTTSLIFLGWEQKNPCLSSQFKKQKWSTGDGSIHWVPATQPQRPPLISSTGEAGIAARACNSRLRWAEPGTSLPKALLPASLTESISSSFDEKLWLKKTRKRAVLGFLVWNKTPWPKTRICLAYTALDIVILQAPTE